MKELAVCTTLAVLAHAAVVVWHLFVLAKIPPGLTGHQVLSAAIAINVVPLMGLVLLWDALSEACECSDFYSFGHRA